MMGHKATSIAHILRFLDPRHTCLLVEVLLSTRVSKAAENHSGKPHHMDLPPPILTPASQADVMAYEASVLSSMY